MPGVGDGGPAKTHLLPAPAIYPQMHQHQQTRREAVGKHLDAGAGSLAAGTAAAGQRERRFDLVLDFCGCRAQQEEGHEQREGDRGWVQRVDRGGHCC